MKAEKNMNAHVRCIVSLVEQGVPLKIARKWVRYGNIRKRRIKNHD